MTQPLSSPSPNSERTVEPYGAAMITDTAFYRNLNYHTAEDTAEKLDYKRMALVVKGVYAAVTDLADQR